MSEKFQLTPVPRTVVVRAGGAILAESRKALLLEEGGYAPVYYIPREDIGMEFLERSDTRTTCPHKGEATYFDTVVKSGTIRDAAWSYETPVDGADELAGRIAFDPEKAFIEEL